jgi:hypothetical protein
MSARQCPNCHATVPADKIVAYSNDLVCPGCGSPLGISALSRNLSAFAGLGAGAIVWWLASAHYSQEPNALGWVWPVLFSYLALSIVAPLTLMAVADLEPRSVDAQSLVQETPPPHSSH